MLTWGVKRGLFSNESGQGSAPIAHAAAKTDEPIREGVVAMLGPFIDTLLICTMTGLVILTTGVWQKKQEQRVVLNEQASVKAIYQRGSIAEDGIVDDEDLASGTHVVRDGRPSDLVLVRNHGTVEGTRLFWTEDSVLLSGLRPFEGSVIFDPEAPGEMARVRRSIDALHDAYAELEATGRNACSLDGLLLGLSGAMASAQSQVSIN